MQKWYVFVPTYQGTYVHAFQLHHVPTLICQVGLATSNMPGLLGV